MQKSNIGEIIMKYFKIYFSHNTNNCIGLAQTIMKTNRVKLWKQT